MNWTKKETQLHRNFERFEKSEITSCNIISNFIFKYSIYQLFYKSSIHDAAHNTVSQIPDFYFFKDTVNEYEIKVDEI